MSERPRLILFFRGTHFYPTEYPKDYKAWHLEAARNPGTTKIMDGLTRKVLWKAPAKGAETIQ